MTFLKILRCVRSLVTLLLVVDHRPVSSVGRASHYHAGGLGFEPQTGPTLRVVVPGVVVWSLSIYHLLVKHI